MTVCRCDSERWFQIVVPGTTGSITHNRDAHTALRGNAFASTVASSRRPCVVSLWLRYPQRALSAQNGHFLLSKLAARCGRKGVRETLFDKHCDTSQRVAPGVEGSRQRAEGSKSVDFIEALFRAAKPPTAHRQLETQLTRTLTGTALGCCVVRAGAPMLPILSSRLSRMGFDRFEPICRSKPRYEVLRRCSKSIGKQVVFANSAKDKMRGFERSNRVCHFAIKTIKTIKIFGGGDDTVGATSNVSSNDLRQSAAHGARSLK